MRTYKDCPCHKHGEKGKSPCSSHSWFSFPHGKPCGICGFDAETDKKIKEIRLNLGCGGQLLEGYINIDFESLEILKEHYPGNQFPNISVYQYDIFNLPCDDGTVSEVRADSLIEHLSFIEEPKFFYEIKRVLKPNGLFRFSTPDFVATFSEWLSASDDWKEFYRNDDEAIAKKHWFGTYTYERNNRWGYLTAMIFGNQNGTGQFHKNCYTEGKIRKMLDYLGFEDIEINRERWRGNRDLMLNVYCKKSIG